VGIVVGGQEQDSSRPSNRGRLKGATLEEGAFPQESQEALPMAALVVYLQNTVFNLRDRQEGQTMAEYALILGGIAIVVILALVFLGGRIRDLFESTGSSVTTPIS
jgi:Flp pilus assembly pilin Flp